MGPLATLVARGVFYLPLELKLADGDRCAVARHWPLSREPCMKTITLKQKWALARSSSSMRKGRAGTAHPKWGDVEEEKRDTAANRTLMAAYLSRP
jgi:hypothetical protein